MTPNRSRSVPLIRVHGIPRRLYRCHYARHEFRSARPRLTSPVFTAFSSRGWVSVGVQVPHGAREALSLRAMSFPSRRSAYPLVTWQNASMHSPELEERDTAAVLGLLITPALAAP